MARIKRGGTKDWHAGQRLIRLQLKKKVIEPFSTLSNAANMHKQFYLPSYPRPVAWLCAGGNSCGKSGCYSFKHPKVRVRVHNGIPEVVLLFVKVQILKRSYD